MSQSEHKVGDVAGAKSKHGKVLMVLTNNDALGDTGQKTGWYLPEVAHPYYEFVNAGYEVDFVTPKGGKAPCDPKSVDQYQDLESRRFITDPNLKAKTQNTLAAGSLTAEPYDAIFYAGGHGPLWDIPEDENIHRLARDIYQKGGAVGAVCHGPAGLVNTKLSNGEYLIAGKKATGFTDEEEEAVQLTSVVPFSLEQVMNARGVEFSSGGKWQNHVVSDRRLVTGQNPASARRTAEETLLAIGYKKVLVVLTNHDQMGKTAKKTGWYLPEVAHPYYVFRSAGFGVDFVTPLGGKAPMDPGSLEQFKNDEQCKQFINDPHLQYRTEHTLKATDVNPKVYSAIFYAGGHGPLWDIPNNEPLQKIARDIYEKQGGVVGAVCHGPAGLLHIKLSNGQLLLQGKQATGFTDAEEEAANATALVPFSLEQEFKKRGVEWSNAAKWEAHVVSDRKVVTGQNPASARLTAEKVIAAM